MSLMTRLPMTGAGRGDTTKFGAKARLIDEDILANNVSGTLSASPRPMQEREDFGDLATRAEGKQKGATVFVDTPGWGQRL